MTDMENFGLALAGMLEDLANRGWEFPIHFVAVGCSGSIMGGTFRRNGSEVEPTFNAEYLEDGRGLALPINMMLVRGDGKEAALVVIETEDWKARFIN